MKSEEAIEHISYLKEVTEKARISAADSYPYFILWGITVLIGFLGNFTFSTPKVWFIVIIGAILSIIMGSILNRGKNATKLLKQIGLQCLILIIAGILIFFSIYKYHDKSLLSAFPPFQFGIIYLVASVHLGRDLMLIGLWMVITSIISLIFPAPFHDIWLAITIGGGMISTGILFRYQLKKERNKSVE